MDERRRIPASLKIVAILFILGGISAVIEVVLGLMRRHININFGVLGLLIGPGLLALKRGWRTCALVFLWIAMIGVPIFAVLVLAIRKPLDFAIFGQKIGHVSDQIGLAVAVFLFVLSVWQYRVLTRSDVRALFGVGK